MLSPLISKVNLLVYRRSYRSTSLPRRSGVLDWVTTLAFFGLLVFVLVRYGQIEQFNPRGNATVLDGDTILISGEKIRLEGIDAPEYRQTCQRDDRAYACGREAKAQLALLTKGAVVNCSGWQNDKYGRLLAICNVGKMSLNRELVLSGWAVSYGNYLIEEAAAKEAGKGIWQGTFDRPSAWRRAHDHLASINDSPHDFWYKVIAFFRRAFAVE